jgi:hypothetical protein
MFGIKYIKAQPNTYLLQYKKGKVSKEGAGLSFFYYSPASSIVAVPLGSMDIPFIFNEVTSDFQEITIQGEITYKVGDPRKLSGLLNFTLGANGSDYSSDDPEKLLKRIINQAQVLVRAQLQRLNLKAALQSSEFLEGEITRSLAGCEMINRLGIDILALSILAIKPNPETSRALEAEIREKLLMEADEAIYDRRNAAVEQERTIKENELNTEVAVEIKKREIRETKLEAEQAVQKKRQLMKQDEMTGKIVIEEKKREYVAISVLNKKEQADAQAYGINAVMGAFKEIDPRIMQALANIHMDPPQLIAAAFQNFAENAGKIGNLNIAPELLRELLDGAKANAA